MNIWVWYVEENFVHIREFINILPDILHATLYEVVMEGWSPEHGVLLANAQSYHKFKSYLTYQYTTSRGAGRKKKIRRRRKSKRKSKRKTKRRKKRTKRRR
jgi:hypothetical protein